MFIRSKLFERHHIDGMFSTRKGGISPAPYNSLNLGLDLGDDEQHVEENLQRLCQQAHIAIPHRCIQVHGIEALICQGKGHQHASQADILLTQSPQTALAVRTADCLPILLVDTQTGVSAAVHAGWRGTAQKIAQHAIKHMQAWGSKPENILASLGPCIGACCFEVSLETAAQLANTHSDAIHHLHIQGQKSYPDLQAINQLQLMDCGLPATNIETIAQCTHCQENDFFSWRRNREKSGRMLAILQSPNFAHKAD